MASAVEVFSGLIKKYEKEIDGMKDGSERDRFEKMVEDMKSVKDALEISEEKRRVISLSQHDSLTILFDDVK